MNTPQAEGNIKKDAGLFTLFITYKTNVMFIYYIIKNRQKRP